LRTIHLGPLHYREGFDGTTAVAHRPEQPGCDRAGESDCRRRARGRLVLNERWALPGEDGGTIRLASRSYREDAEYDELDITPPHGTRGACRQREDRIDRARVEPARSAHEHGQARRIPRARGAKRPSVFSAPTLLPSDSRSNGCAWTPRG